MLGLSANLNYYLLNGNVDLRKGIFRLCESIREEMSLDPSDASNVYMFMSRNRKVVKILHYERGFYVLYEKRPVMGKFKKPVFTLWLTRLPMGSVSTDGYTVYRMFDGEASKVLHIGCWTHCRRLWVDALPSDRTAMDIIDPIGDMFRNEDLFRTMKLSGEQIKEKRLKLTRPILERIHHKVVMMMQDTKLMANELMRKAVNYTINQWKSLKNILKDGSAEISNNLCEQRMKPVKLLLKNCMNIGSEDAAGNSAFIFSLIESCKLNDIDPQDYLKHLFECILHGKDCDKKALLPCFYQSEC